MREPGFYWVQGNWEGAVPEIALWSHRELPKGGAWLIVGAQFPCDQIDYVVLSDRLEPPK